MSLLHAPAQAAQVAVLQLHDTVQPMSQEFLTRGLAQAAESNSDVLVLELDTPGGLLTSTRSMVGQILRSQVPVIVYVSPDGARAASAGFFLLQAADVAAMAPATNTGAAHPVGVGGQMDETMRLKVENDAVAFLQSYQAARGRDAKLGETAIRSSKSWSADEAISLHLIDVLSPSLNDLLKTIDGRTIRRFDGTTTTLHTWPANLVRIEPSLRERILSKLMDPNLALLTLIAGVLLIYLEFNIPGTVLPGAAGLLLLVAGLFALNMLPINYFSAALLFAGMVVLLLEAMFPSHGALAVLGSATVVFAAATLVRAPIHALAVSLPFALALGIAFSGITFTLARLAAKARANKTRIGPAALVGSKGIVMEALTPLGRILVQGEIWQARSTEPAAIHEQVLVTGVDELTLLVARVPATTDIPETGLASR